MSKKDTIVGKAIKDRAEMDNAKIRQEVKEGAEARDKLAKMETKEEIRLKEIGNKYLDGTIYEEERVVSEYHVYGRQTVTGIIEMGKRLLASKEYAGHGKFMRMLDERFKISEPSAWRLMAIARKFLNSSRVKDLRLVGIQDGIGKLYALLNVPDEELAEFDETGMFKGCTVEDLNKMSVKDLQNLLKEKENWKAKAKQLELDVQGKYDTQKQYKDKLAKQEKEIKALKANLAGISGEEADVLKQFESLKIQGRGLMRMIETANPKRLTEELKIELKDLAQYIHERAELMLGRIIEMVDGERFSADREIAEKEFYENHGEEAD